MVEAEKGDEMWGFRLKCAFPVHFAVALRSVVEHG